MGDPGLGAVDHPTVALPDGLGAQGGGVRTGGRLGEAVRPEQAAAQHGGQVLDLLLLGAVGGEGVGRERVDADAQADGEPGRGQLLQDLEIDLVGLVAAAVLGRVRQAQQAGFGEQTEDLTRETSRVLLLRGPGRYLALGDLPDEGEQIPRLFRRQLTLHRLRVAVGHGVGLLPVRAPAVRPGVGGGSAW